MLKNFHAKQKVAVFLGIIFLLELTLIMLPIRLNTAIFMFVPMASVLITMLLTGEAFSKKGWAQLGFQRLQLKYILYGISIPVIPILIGYSVVWASGLGKFGLPAEYTDKVPYLVVGFFITFIVSSLTVTLGEEVGWRGFLAAKLKGLPLKKAILLNGLIWAVFHLPIMVFTDLYHSDVNLYIFIPMFIVTVTLAGAFFTYLTYATGSIWPAVAAHTAHNLVWNYGDLLTLNAKPIVPYLTGDAGIVLIVFYLIVYGWILKKERKSPATKASVGVS